MFISSIRGRGWRFLGLRSKRVGDYGRDYGGVCSGDGGDWGFRGLELGSRELENNRCEVVEELCFVDVGMWVS